MWWPRNYTHSFLGDYECLDYALRATRAFIEEHGPFDCCIGFSQGANFLAHLLPLLEKPWLHEAFASPTPSSSSFMSPRSSISASSDSSLASTPYSIAPSSASTMFSPPLSPVDSDYFGRSRRSSFGQAVQVRDSGGCIRPGRLDRRPLVRLESASANPAPHRQERRLDPAECVELSLLSLGENSADSPSLADHQIDTANKFNSKILWHIGGASPPSLELSMRKETS